MLPSSHRGFQRPTPDRLIFSPLSSHALQKENVWSTDGLGYEHNKVGDWEAADGVQSLLI